MFNSRWTHVELTHNSCGLMSNSCTTHVDSQLSLVSASQHRQQLGASSPAGSDVEVPQVEVLRARVQQHHPAAERQPLAARVGDGVRSSSAWANCCPPSSAHEGALGHLAAAPTSALVVGAPDAWCSITTASAGARHLC